jgi:hypothetical protein
LGTSALPAANEAHDRARLVQNYDRLPLSFEANQGQADAQVKFLSRGSGYSVYLTDRAAILALHKPAGPAPGISATGSKSGALTHRYRTDDIRMEIVGANRDRQVAGTEQLPGYVNYFIGQDPAQWRRNVPTYARVQYSGVYPGVDLVYYSHQGQLEYDFILAPRADPNSIELRFAGARKMTLTAEGDLTVAAAHGQVAFHKPVIYQEANGHRLRVAGGFMLRDDGGIGFSLGRYDRSKSLIIDPVLEYSTYMGGSNVDSAYAIAVDGDGSAYVAGDTNSANFPVTKGALDTKYKGQGNLFVNFVSKLNRSGTALLYSTYLGSGACYGEGSLANGLLALPRIGLTVDGDGNAYIAGSVCSGEFPVTKGAFQTTILAGGAPAYVAKLNSAGSDLIYATYLGGSGGDVATALAVDAAGDAFVAGYTASIDFPVTSGAFQTENRGAANLAFNGFVTELNPTGTNLVFSTYLGGSGGFAGSIGDIANAIALDRNGSAYVAGVTFSDDFPITKGAFQTRNRGYTAERVSGNAFVSKLNATGTALMYSSYLGGSGSPGSAGADAAYALAVDGSGNAYIAGSAVSPNFPVTPGAFQRKNKAAGVGQYPGNNGFITKVDLTGEALVYSTFLGGSANGMASDGAGGDAVNAITIDHAGHAYVTGITSSADFPVTQGAFQTVNRSFSSRGFNGFVAELDSSGATLVSSTYLGGSGQDFGTALSMDTGGMVYVAGYALSHDFPVSEEAFRETNHGFINAFIAKLDLRDTTTASVTTLSSSANPQTVGKPVTFTAAVAPTAPTADGAADRIPTGSVEFLINNDVDEQFAVKVPLDAAGKATYTTDALASGSYSVVASYAILAANFGPSSSPALTETIQNSSDAAASQRAIQIAAGNQ